MIYKELIDLLDFNNIDLYLREVKENNFSYKLIFFSSLIDEAMLMELQRSIRMSENKNQVISKLDNIKIKVSNEVKDAISLLHEGQTILYLNDENYFIMVDIRKTPLRSIGESEAEKSIRGAKDGFNESLITNISLIRGRIKSNDLKVEGYKVGKVQSLCLLYLDNLVDKHKLDDIKNKINSIKKESYITSEKELEELIFSQNKTIFPLVRFTERPDVTSIYLSRGYFVLMLENNASVLILPISLFDHLKNVEEYSQNFIIGNFTKFIRLVGFILSLYFLPLSYIFSTSSCFTTLNIENTSSIPLSLQFLIGVFVIELFRNAIIHTPNSLSLALSIVVGFILGEVSMSLGIFMKDVLIVLSIFTISSFAIPSYELSLTCRVLSIFLLVISILFSLPGFIVSVLLIFIHLTRLKVLSYPYLYPLIPLNLKELKNKVTRRKKEK